MPNNSKKPSKSKLPHFASEAEEADWHAGLAERRAADQAFQRAIKAGKIIRNDSRKFPSREMIDRAAREGAVIVNAKGLNIRPTDPAVLQELMDRVKEKQTKAISLRIPISHIEAAKALGEGAGIGYQTVLKQIIDKALRSAR